MRILLISPEFPPYKFGGLSLLLKEISDELKKRKHEITVISGYKGKKIKIIKNKIFLPLVFSPTYELELSMPPTPKSLIFLLKFLRKNKFDIIHLHGYGHLLTDVVALICKIMKRDYILSIHGYPQPSHSILKLFFNLYSFFIGKITLKNSKAITTVSSKTMNITHKLVKNKKTILLPNFIDLGEWTKDYRKGFLRKKFGIKEKKIILSVGSLRRVKGFQYLILALSILKRKGEKNLKIIIAGKDVGFGEKLKMLSRELGVDNDILFAGEFSREDIKNALKDADLFVLPSEKESFGISLLEAAAVGTQIVASDSCEIALYLKKKGVNIILFKSKNPYSLALSIQKALRRKGKKCNKSKLKEFDKKVVIKKLITIYEEQFKTTHLGNNRSKKRRRTH